MTDEVLDMDGRPAAAPDLIEPDAHGDPNGPKALGLTDSTERTRARDRWPQDGLRRLRPSDPHQPLKAEYWRGFMTRMDQRPHLRAVCRPRLCSSKENETPRSRRRIRSPWRIAASASSTASRRPPARSRRQLATCHRGDLVVDEEGRHVDDMARKLNAARRMAVRQAVRQAPALILPEDIPGIRISSRQGTAAAPVDRPGDPSFGALHAESARKAFHHHSRRYAVRVAQQRNRGETTVTNSESSSSL